MPKRYQLSQNVIDHIFRGDDNEGSLAGFHSEAVVRDAALVFTGDNQARRLGGTLTYVASATVSVGGTRLGPKTSSFFPRN